VIGGPADLAASARLALERRGVTVVGPDVDGAAGARTYSYSAATGLYRLLRSVVDDSNSVALPAWVGGASSSYEAVARERGLGFMDLPDSEDESSSYALPPEARRYDTAWGLTTEHSATEAPRISATGYDLSPLSAEAVLALAESLPPAARAVLLEGATEAPGSYDAMPAGAGLYRCALGGLPLFSSAARLPSTTGWPSFRAPLCADHLVERADNSAGMARTEVLCARSRTHLGHVFDDVGAAGQRRYCINGAALVFEPAPAGADPRLATAVLAGGCFWGLQHTLLSAAGVVEATAGYARVRNGAEPAGGADEAAALSYERLRSGLAPGWFEAVRVVFNVETAPAERLFDFFFRAHDATASAGGEEPWQPHYASAVLLPAGALDLREAATACAARALVDASGGSGSGAIAAPTALATRIVGGERHAAESDASQDAFEFAPAEERQQSYLTKRGKPIVVRPLPGSA
jgi:peptide-methionine (R)-S-oxide reductase